MGFAGVVMYGVYSELLKQGLLLFLSTSHLQNQKAPRFMSDFNTFWQKILIHKRSSMLLLAHIQYKLGCLFYLCWVKTCIMSVCSIEYLLFNVRASCWVKFLSTSALPPTHTLSPSTCTYTHTHSYFNHLNLIILPLLLCANQWCHPQRDSGVVGSVPEGVHAGRRGGKRTGGERRGAEERRGEEEVKRRLVLER